MILVIFDVDGTLAYSERRDSLSFARAYENIYGRQFPTIDWRAYPHVTDTTIFDTVIREHFGRAVTDEEVECFQAHYMDLLREGRRAAPDAFREVAGARRLVEQLLAGGRHLVGVATGGWRRPAELKLGHVGINIGPELFSGADGKVNREAILEEVIARAQQLNGSAPTKAVYIGDAEWDVRTTRNMQLSFIGVRYQGDCEVLLKEGARHVIRDFQDTAHFERLLEMAEPPGGQ
ncbi:MAG: HAD family hydrolase [Phaeodactylibacter sp.]|nr:HAD family hydrolase [Phaeodactylibacter sp.]MCB9274854.1 HAD family hydrolase [Lewinellaceae bacterium]